MLDLLHTYTDPKPLCSMLLKNCRYLSASLKTYIKALMAVSVAAVEVDASSASAHLRSVFINSRRSVSPEDVSNILQTFQNRPLNLQLDRLPTVIRQLLLYVQMEVENPQVLTQDLVSFYFVLLEGLIQHFCNETIKRKASAMHAVVTTTLSHPVIVSAFLSASPDKIDLPSLATDFVLHLLDASMDDGVGQSELALLKPYKDKLLSYAMQRELPSDRTYVLWRLEKLLDSFMPFLDGSDIISLVESLTESDTRLNVLDPHARALVQLLDSCVLSGNIENFSARCICKLFEIVCRQAIQDEDCSLEASLTRILQDYPIYCMAMSEELTLTMLEHLTANRLAIVENLARFSLRHAQIIHRFVALRYRSFDSWDPVSVITLVNVYLRIEFARGNSDASRTKSVCSQYWMSLLRYVQSPDCDHDSSVLFACTDLLLRHHVVENSQVLTFIEGVMDHVANGAVPSLVLMNLVIQLLWHLNERSDTVEPPSPMSRLVTLCVVTMTALLKEQHNAQVHCLALELASEGLNALQHCSSIEVLAALGDGEAWPSFAKSVLKVSFRESPMSMHLLSFFEKCCQYIYEKTSQVKPLPLTSLYQMVFGHSRFLSIMLDGNENCKSLKDSVVDLLTTLVLLDKTVCQKEHIPVLLGAYGATLSMTDQKLLYLMKLYEDSGVSMYEYRPYLWGAAAVSHYSVRKNIELSLWKQPKVEEVLGLLEEGILIRTAIHFPLHVALEPEPPTFGTDGDTHIQSLYDPRFLLPLLGHLLSPGTFVHCYKFLESRILALILGSLASQDSNMRAAGYYVLGQFYQHLEGSTFRGRHEWLTVLDAIRNSLEKSNTRLAPIITCFLVKTYQLFLRPDDSLYQPIYRFLMLKPCLDVRNVPEFYKLFYSSDIEWQQHQEWILSVMRDGLRTSLDFHIFQKRYIFNILMAFCNSPLCNVQGKVFVLQILKHAVAVPSSAQTLCRRHGLLPWLHGIICSHRLHMSQLLPGLCSLMDVLWQSSLQHNQNRHSGAGKSSGIAAVDVGVKEDSEDRNEASTLARSRFDTEVRQTHGTKLLYDVFASEFLATQLSLLLEFKTPVDVLALMSCLKCLKSTLLHMGFIDLPHGSYENGIFCFVSEIHIEKLLDIGSHLHRSMENRCKKVGVSEDVAVEPETNRPWRQVPDIRTDSTVGAEFECCRLVSELVPVWRPWVNPVCSIHIRKTVYYQTVAVLLRALNFMLHKEYNTNVHTERMAIWLLECLRNDPVGGLSVLLLSNNGVARQCLKEMLCRITLLLASVEPSNVNGNKDAKALCHLENVVLFLVNCLPRHTESDLHSLAVSPPYVEAFHGKSTLHFECGTTTVEVKETAVLLQELWLKKERPLLYEALGR